MHHRLCYVVVSIAVCAIAGVAHAQTPALHKVAFYNIKGGTGAAALPGHPKLFEQSQNCNDPSKPLNAWGLGLVQETLRASVGADPDVIALGLAEAWSCATTEKVRQVLGWKARTGERNGLAVVARHGLAGPEQWLQLDTSYRETPTDTKWVVRVPVCTDAACSRSIVVYAAHWASAPLEPDMVAYDPHELDTLAFMRQDDTRPHVLIGDLNAFGGPRVCGQDPTAFVLARLRDAGYVDVWPAVHGSAEGFTGMANRLRCGVPEGHAWKRVDYAWVKGLHPAGMSRFGMVPPGHAAPSDHYGIIATLADSAPTTPPPAATSRGEIVLRASSVTRTSGAWRAEADPTAAEGRRLRHPDAGAPKLMTALAAPLHYVEMSFDADAGRPYRLWIRGRADRDSYHNDSVFVQFSGSVRTSGQPVYRIGTTSATTIVLEDCHGCGLRGWGWQDTGYGLGVLGPLVQFATSGRQTLRIQTREDGLAIDQVVLSSDTYRTAAPGPPKQDATILPVEFVPPALPVTPDPPVGVPEAPTLDPREIVLRTSSATTVAGRWRTESDTSAAEGRRLRHPDAGAPKLMVARSEPADYVEMHFDAEAGRPYRIWIRGRADGNSYNNDSVFVQFSGTVTANGAPIHRIGTTSATIIVLEDCHGCGLSGWGWQDNGYGLGVLGPTVRFETTGRQTLRLQTREDGLAIDQVVVSSGRYLTTPPGPPTQDATILP